MVNNPPNNGAVENRVDIYIPPSDHINKAMLELEQERCTDIVLQNRYMVYYIIL